MPYASALVDAAQAGNAACEPTLLQIADAFPPRRRFIRGALARLRFDDAPRLFPYSGVALFFSEYDAV